MDVLPADVGPYRRTGKLVPAIAFNNKDKCYLKLYVTMNF